MARYIDADKAIELHNGELWAWDVPDLKEFLADLPTADVVPKSEYEMAIKEVCRLSQEVLLNCESTEFEVREARARLAREIFEEIEGCFMFGERIYSIDKPTFAELKKKYTEAKE